MQHFTTRQLFTALLLFSITGTFFAAVSPTFMILLIGRIVQAAGTAIILPLMTQLTLLVYPIHKRGAAMGKIGLVIVFAPAIGPTVAGLVMNQFSWHFIFWLSLPFLVLAFLIGLKFVRNVSEVQEIKFDALSIALSTIGFGGILYGFSVSGKLGTFMATEVLVTAGIGILALIIFGCRQTKMEQPMLNLRVFTFRMYSLGVSLIMICMMMILSTANYVNANGDTMATQLEGSIQGVQNSITFGLIIGFVLSIFIRRVK